jgi:DNA modification methylase
MTEIVVGDARVVLGDCRDVLRTLADNSVDSVVTDPPYEIGFMGRSWDSTGIAYDVTVWDECLRVLKPGGHILAFGGSRTWHRLAVAVEDAGFEIRDSIAWIYGSGFPKSLDVSKAIDKNNGKHEVDLAPFGDYVRGLREAKGYSRKQLDDLMGTTTAVSWWEGRASGVQLPSQTTYNLLKTFISMDGRYDSLIEWAEAEREVIGTEIRYNEPSGIVNVGQGKRELFERKITTPSTAEAQQWSGWGTALKPAFEPIVVGRKPFGKGVTVAENVLAWGVGGLNIDGSRIAGAVPSVPQPKTGGGIFSGDGGRNGEVSSAPQGRWPANVILDEVTAGLVDEQSGQVKGQVGMSKTKGDFRFIEGDTETVQKFDQGKTDSGGASRFFYQAKASKRDRNEGLEGLQDSRGGSERMNNSDGRKAEIGESDRLPVTKNHHPTVKPTQLMRYLIKLVTPPGGTVLDPFTGSGSTGKAALLDGYKFVGAELTAEYLPIIEGRLRWALEHADEETLF